MGWSVMVVSLWAVPGTSGGLDGQLQVGELGVQAVEVIALAGDRQALLRDERRQVEVDRAPLEAEPCQAPASSGRGPSDAG